MSAFPLRYNLIHKPKQKLTLNGRAANLSKDFSKNKVHFSGNMEVTRLFSNPETRLT
jgi:hypothetical protein